jgi:hypothetical protein
LVVHRAQVSAIAAHSYTAQIAAPFRRLQVSQRSSMLRAVFDPPALSGIIWSNSSRSREPKSTRIAPILVGKGVAPCAEEL